MIYLSNPSFLLKREDMNIKNRFPLILVIISLTCMPSIIFSKTPVSLEKQINKIVKEFHGKMGVSFHHLKKQDTIEINSDELFPTASTIKLAILCEAFHQLDENKLQYYSTTTYSTTRRVGGAGFLQNYENGRNIELKEAIHFMITVSDNIATNMVIDWLGGFTPINEWLINHGFAETRSLTYIGGGNSWNEGLAKEWGIGKTTPKEMRQLMEMIVEEKAASPEACHEMIRILSHQYFDGVMPGGLPPDVFVSSKSGAISSSRSEIMYVNSPSGPYVVVVYTKDNQDRRWENDNEAEVALRNISNIIWNYYNHGKKYLVTENYYKYE